VTGKQVCHDVIHKHSSVGMYHCKSGTARNAFCRPTFWPHNAYCTDLFHLLPNNFSVKSFHITATYEN